MNTIVGGICSLALYMTLLMYASIKFNHLVTKHNPNISSFELVDELIGQSINLNKQNFRFAFTIESYKKPKVQKNDPRYVKYIFQLFGKRKGEFY